MHSLSQSRVSPADLGSFFVYFSLSFHFYSLSLSLPPQSATSFQLHVPYKLWVLLPIYSSSFSSSVSNFVLSNKYKNILSIRFFILLPINNSQIQIEISVWCRLGTLWHAIIWFFCYLLRTQMMGVVYSLNWVLN